MPDLKNSFLAGIMNKDLDERLVPEGVYRDALNVDIDTADGGNIGAVKNKSGNTLIANVWNVAGFPYPQTTHAKTIGAVASEKDGLIYWFVTSDQFDGIYEHDTNNGATVRVLQSNKPNPTYKSKLNFDKNYIITGVNYVNGFLYWTDNYNPPRRINISRVKSDYLGIGGYTIDDPRIDEDINVILAPPLNAPKISLSENIGTQSNNMEEKFLYFSYRYKYVDNQYSALSPFSAVAFQPKDYQLDYRAGNNKSMVNRFKEANITVFTGNQFVKEIQVVMRDVRSMNTYIIETFNKEDLNISDQVFKSFTFNNNKTYTILSQDQITRLFDNVPLLSKAQDFVGNRIMYGNYTQFYDIDYPVNLLVDYSSVENTGEAPIQTFRSDRDYEIGIIYTDKYGRSTTALTSDKNTIYIPPTQSDKGNSIRLDILNKPPQWATNFRIVIKQSKDQYYNIFPLDVRSSSVYRYFLINESDRDKLSIGDYIIFKSGPSGPTYSNKKYKILEIKDKSTGFITGATAGLYFKIKVDNQNELNTSQGVSTSWFASEGNDMALVNAFGGNLPLNTNAWNQYTMPSPVKNLFKYVENPIHYGDGSPGALSVVNNNQVISTGIIKDYRYTIEALPNNQFSYTNDLSGANTTIENITLSDQVIYGDGAALFKIKWNYAPVVGDVWKINVRNDDNYFDHFIGIPNYFGGSSATINTEYPNAMWVNNIGGYVVLGEPNISLQQINEGDIITITIGGDLYNPEVYTTPQVFPPSPSTYENIEEWFVESGACNDFILKNTIGVNIGKKAVSFRRGTKYTGNSGNGASFDYVRLPQETIPQQVLYKPVFMIIKGFGHDSDSGAGNQPGINIFSASMTIRRISNQIIAETAPSETELEVFHELSRTYSISNGFHKVRWKYSDFTYVTNTTYVGKTNLGQLNPGSTPTANDQMHNYVAGEKVYVNSSAFSGYYDILFVPDPYNIIIDLAFPGSGPVTPGYVSYDSIENDQTSYNISGNAATIKINNPGNTINSDFNAWSYSNALETMRIRDDLNAAKLEYSPRVTAEIDEYKQKFSKNAISYSGVYGENTNFNALNEFNLSKANFKYLDSEFGSIQKLYARDTDLIVFQEDKVSSVLYGKNLLSDAVGGGQVVSVPEVLGTQIAFPVEYGISINPESFGVWGDSVYFADSKRGAILTMSGNQIQEISALGMQDYFIDLMREYPDTQKLGCYDPHNQAYVLANNDISVTNCNLRLNRLSKNVASNTSSFANNLFTIICDVSWSITLQDMGYGTSWVSNYQLFGFGTTDITAIIAQNLTGSNRSLRFVVTYCDNKQIKFQLTQGASPAGNIINVVIHNPPRPTTGYINVNEL